MNHAWAKPSSSFPSLLTQTGPGGGAGHGTCDTVLLSDGEGGSDGSLTENFSSLVKTSVSPPEGFLRVVLIMYGFGLMYLL